MVEVVVRLDDRVKLTQRSDTVLPPVAAVLSLSSISRATSLDRARLLL